MLVDTHAHLDDLKYEEDRQEVIARAKAEGTTRIITMGDTMESSFNAIKIADNFDGVFAGAGVHPQEALSIQSSKDYDTLAELMTLPKVKVLGEIGLDYYYENAPREVQREVFIRQLDVARQMHMPVSIHDRDAHGDTMAILKKEGKSTMYWGSKKTDMSLQKTSASNKKEIFQSHQTICSYKTRESHRSETLSF